MSDASDWRCGRLVHHIPVEGIVLGFLHAIATVSLISLRLVVSGRLHLYNLPVLYRRIIIMFVGAVSTKTDDLPLLCWWMLCRPCFVRLADVLPPLLSYFDGCFAIMFATYWSSSTDALPSW